MYSASAFTIRSASSEDFKEVRRLCNRDRRIDPMLTLCLQREFEACVTSPASRSVVLSSTRSQSKGRITAILLAIFVRNDFVDECLSADTPFVASRIVSWLDSGSDPFPSAREMAAGSTGEGLNLLLTEWAVDDRGTLSEFNRAKRQALAAFATRHGGWKLRRMMAEACYPDQHAGLRRVGFRIWNAYDAWNSVHSTGKPAFVPILFGMERANTRDINDDTILRLFDWSPPKCTFTADQIQVLDLLLDGLDDAEIRERLGLSPESLRKRWSRIYQEIERAYPHAFRPTVSGIRGSAHEFLLDHLYEVRPHESVRGRRAGRPRQESRPESE